MSYEGYEERLCTRGHYTTFDCYEDAPLGCPYCGASFEFRHAVDQTNGYDESDPHTCNAPKVEKGFMDVWKRDHHGNDYAEKVPEYEPVPGSAWAIHTRPIERTDT